MYIKWRYEAFFWIAGIILAFVFYGWKLALILLLLDIRITTRG